MLVSPQRTGRPWQGQTESPHHEQAPSYDPTCYLCPGNARAGGGRNPVYGGTFMFENDFPALVPDPPKAEAPVHALLLAQAERGVCEVVCFSPRHDLTLARMEAAEVRAVVDTWCDESERLAALPFINYVQIFENRGAMMGASNPHPHCQIWASESVPNEPAKETAAQRRHLEETGSCLLCEYSRVESECAERLVCANDSFLAVVPFWAVWPFEVLVISRRHAAGITGLDDLEKTHLAEILRRVTAAYDALFAAPFPYSMGFHQQPTDGQFYPEWHVHAHFYPPLLRSAKVRKFMVGYEMLATPQRDLTPEEAAARLRAVAG